MRSFIPLLLPIAGLCLVASLQAQDTKIPDHTQRQGQHQHHAHQHGLHTLAPVGVMGDHIHLGEEWMFSYRYMRMEMRGNRDGTDSASTSEVLSSFMVAPTKMTMEMHMLGLMYAPSNDLTVMVMAPYVFKEMDHVTGMGARFTTRADGLGDVKTTALLRVFQHDLHSVHLNLGISAPTGDIDMRDDTPAMSQAKLPYPMQLGSGTADLLPGVTYAAHDDQYSWGAQASATVRLGRNSNDYSLGDRVGFTTWAGFKPSPWLNTSLRLDYQVWDDIDGADPQLTPGMVPTARPDLRSGHRVDLLLGCEFLGEGAHEQGHYLGVEVGMPIYQDLDGPQLETDFLVNFGWRMVF